MKRLALLIILLSAISAAPSVSADTLVIVKKEPATKKAVAKKRAAHFNRALARQIRRDIRAHRSTIKVVLPDITYRPAS